MTHEGLFHFKPGVLFLSTPGVLFPFKPAVLFRPPKICFFQNPQSCFVSFRTRNAVSLHTPRAGPLLSHMLSLWWPLRMLFMREPKNSFLSGGALSMVLPPYSCFPRLSSKLIVIKVVRNDPQVALNAPESHQKWINE